MLWRYLLGAAARLHPVHPVSRENLDGDNSFFPIENIEKTMAKTMVCIQNSS